MPSFAKKFIAHSRLDAYETSAALAALLLMLVMLIVDADSDIASDSRAAVPVRVAGSGPALLLCPDLSAPFLPNPAQRHGAVLANQIHKDALFGGAGTWSICPRH